MANVSTGPRSAASHNETAGSDSTSRGPPVTASATQPMSGQRAGLPDDGRDQGLRPAEKMGGGEQHRERGRPVPERRARLPGGPAPRLYGVRGEHQGSSRLHRPRLRGGATSLGCVFASLVAPPASPSPFTAPPSLIARP